MLVRRVGKYGHFNPEQRPEFDLAAAPRAHHAEVMGQTNRVLMCDLACRASSASERGCRKDLYFQIA